MFNLLVTGRLVKKHCHVCCDAGGLFWLRSFVSFPGFRFAGSESFRDKPPKEAPRYPRRLRRTSASQPALFHTSRTFREGSFPFHKTSAADHRVCNVTSATFAQNVSHFATLSLHCSPHYAVGHHKNVITPTPPQPPINSSREIIDVTRPCDTLPNFNQVTVAPNVMCSPSQILQDHGPSTLKISQSCVEMKNVGSGDQL